MARSVLYSGALLRSQAWSRREPMGFLRPHVCTFATAWHLLNRMAAIYFFVAFGLLRLRTGASTSSIVSCKASLHLADKGLLSLAFINIASLAPCYICLALFLSTIEGRFPKVMVGDAHLKPSWSLLKSLLGMPSSRMAFMHSRLLGRSQKGYPMCPGNDGPCP